jgi:hypothetical protein
VLAVLEEGAAIPKSVLFGEARGSSCAAGFDRDRRSPALVSSQRVPMLAAGLLDARSCPLAVCSFCLWGSRRRGCGAARPRHRNAEFRGSNGVFMLDLLLLFRRWGVAVSALFIFWRCFSPFWVGASV